MTDKKHTPETIFVKVFCKDRLPENKGSYIVNSKCNSSSQLESAEEINFNGKDFINIPNWEHIWWLEEIPNPLAGIDNPVEWVAKVKKELAFYKTQCEALGKCYVTLLEEKEQLQAENERLRASLTEIRNYTPATSGYSNEAAMKRIAGEAIKGESLSPMEGKAETEEESFFCSEWNKVGFRCDVGQCEKCAKEEGKTPLKGWISVEERLPEENQLVWGWDGKSTIFMWCRVYDKSEGWFQAISYGQPYGENGKIVADCEIEDIDVKYWQPLPELKLGDK